MNTNEISNNYNLYHFPFEVEPEQVPESVQGFLGTLAEDTRALTGLIESVRREATKIKTNGDLSEQGQQKRLLDTMEKVVQPVLEGLEARTEGLDFEIERARQDLESALDKAGYSPPKDPMERIVDQLQLQEIRQQLLAMDHGKRMEVYRLADEQGQALVCRAIEEAPRFYGIVPQDYIMRVKSARLERSSPDLFRRGAVLKQLKETYLHNIQRTHKLCQDITGTGKAKQQQLELKKQQHIDTANKAAAKRQAVMQ